jgi:hypothetical protein
MLTLPTCFGLSACKKKVISTPTEPDNVTAVEKVVLSSVLMFLQINVTPESTITAEVVGADNPAQTVTWYSSNPKVATVDNGKVTAVYPGITIITATSTVDNHKYASCTVSVLSAPK